MLWPAGNVTKGQVPIGIACAPKLLSADLVAYIAINFR